MCWLINNDTFMNGLENLKAVRARFNLFPKQMETGKGSEIVEDSKDDFRYPHLESSENTAIPQFPIPPLLAMLAKSVKRIYNCSLRHLRLHFLPNLISISNNMFSSAISCKYLSTSKFSKDNKIAPARRAGAICGLWKNYKCLLHQIAR